MNYYDKLCIGIILVGSYKLCDNIYLNVNFCKLLQKNILPDMKI